MKGSKKNTKTPQMCYSMEQLWKTLDLKNVLRVGWSDMEGLSYQGLVC